MAKAVLLIGIVCIVTLAVFGIMVYLMMSVNPPPLIADEKGTPVLSEFDLPYISVENGADMINPSHRAFDTHENHKSAVSDDNLMLYAVQRVVPPLWPLTPEPPLGDLDQRREDNKSKRNEYVTTTNKGVFLFDKRSVDDGETRRRDLDSIILKVTDDTGKFNIEIKIGPDDESTKKQIKTREIKSKVIPKYSMSLKTKNYDLFKISELAKSTIVHVKPNDSVSIDYYDDHKKSKTTVNHTIIQASIIDLINSTDKTAVMPLDKDLLPIAFFSNKTKLTNHSDTNAKEIDKEFIAKNKSTNMTANDTACNITVQIENTTLQTFVTNRNENTKNLLLL